MKGSTIFLVILGLVIALAGGVFAMLMWKSYERAVDQRGWPQVEGVVLSSEVEEWRHDDYSPKEYRLKILYGYEWKGEQKTSERIGVRGNPSYNKQEKLEKMVGEYPAGSKVRVYVNPAESDYAILKPDSKAAGYSLWFPLLFVVGGLGIVVGAVRNAFFRRARL